MPLSKLARYGDEDLPRCSAHSETADDNANPTGLRGRWECTLPAGHTDFDNDRVRKHSWVKVD